MCAAIRQDVSETRRFASQHGGLCLVYVAPELPVDLGETIAAETALELETVAMEGRA